MKHPSRSLSGVVLALLACAAVAQAQTNINPAARKHVKMVGPNAFKYTTKLTKVVELNFTFGFHHSDSKPLIAATLTRVAKNYAYKTTPADTAAFTVQRFVGPSSGTASGLPSPSFTLTDLLSGQVIFANQISAMGNTSMGTANRNAIRQAIYAEGRGFFFLHGSGDDETRAWSFYTDTLHSMTYQGHGDRTPGPVYKNPTEKDHIVTENVLVAGMTTATVPTSVDGGGNEVLTSQPTRAITNEWYRFGSDIRTVPAKAANLTVLSLYDPRNLGTALPATYRRKGGNMYTYLYKVGAGMTHYLPAGHDNSEIMASGGFDGGQGDWDRYYAQVLFFLAGYNVTPCDTSCNGLPIVTSDNHLTGTTVAIKKGGGFRIVTSDIQMDALNPAFTLVREANYSARLLDVSGKERMRASGKGTRYAFDASQLNSGVYFMHVNMAGSGSLTKRYVISAR